MCLGEGWITSGHKKKKRVSQYSPWTPFLRRLGIKISTRHFEDSNLSKIYQLRILTLFNVKCYLINQLMMI